MMVAKQTNGRQNESIAKGVEFGEVWTNNAKGKEKEIGRASRNWKTEIKEKRKRRERFD